MREEYELAIPPLQQMVGRAEALEREIASQVHAAYGLSDEQISLLWRTAPPRMPVDILPTSN